VQTRLSLQQAVKRKGRAKDAKTPRSPRVGPAAALRAGAAQHAAPAAATPQAAGPSAAFVAALDQCGVCNRALNRQLRVVQQQLAAVDAERAALRQGLAAADDERAALRQGLGEAAAERAALRQGLGEAAAERAALCQGLGEAERKCSALREELARAHASKAVAALHLRQLHWYSDVRAWTRLLVVAQARAPLPPRAPPPLPSSDAVHLRLALSRLAATAPQSAPVLYRRSAVRYRRDTFSLQRIGRAAGWRAAGRGRLRQRHGGRACGDRRTGRQARQPARRAGARCGARRMRGVLPRRGALQARARIPRNGGAGRGRAGALPLHRYGARPRSRRSGCEAVLAGRSGPVAGACRRAAGDAGRRLRCSGRWGHWRDVGKVRRGPWRVHGRRSARARSCLLAFAPRGPCSAVSVRARAGAGVRAGG